MVSVQQQNIQRNKYRMNLVKLKNLTSKDMFQEKYDERCPIQK